MRSSLPSTPLRDYLWRGEILLSGHADAHSDQFVRILIRVVPGAICEEKPHQHDQPTVILHRLLSLIGSEVTIPPGSGDGEVWIQGAPKLSKLIICKPCGEKEDRTSFWYALRSGVLLSPSLNGLCSIVIGKETTTTPTTTSTTATSRTTNDNSKQVTLSRTTQGHPAHIRLTSNKYRLVFTVVTNITVTGLIDHYTLLYQNKGNPNNIPNDCNTASTTDTSNSSSNNSNDIFALNVVNNLLIDHRSSGFQRSTLPLKLSHAESSTPFSSSSESSVRETVWARYRMTEVRNKSGTSNTGNGTITDPVWLKVKRDCIIGPGAEGSCYRLLGLRKMYRNDFAKLQSLFSTSFTISAYDFLPDNGINKITDPKKDSVKETKLIDDKKDTDTGSTETTVTISDPAPSFASSSLFSTVPEYSARYLTYEDITRSMTDIQMYIKNTWLMYVVKRIVIVQKIIKGWVVRRKVKKTMNT